MNRQFREIRRIIKPQPVIEGAGVRLKRSIATATLDHLDPFLLFDHAKYCHRTDSGNKPGGWP